jgi:hypothetical protein
MSNAIYRPRLSVELTKDQYDRFNLATPYGMKRMIVTRLLEEFIEFAAQDANNIMKVYQGQFTLVPEDVQKELEDA